jgi:hypothetical protein
MSFRITFRPPGRALWDEFLSTPIEQLRGAYGLWDNSPYLLPTDAEFEFADEKLYVPAIGLLDIALSFPYLAKVVTKFGQLEVTFGDVWGRWARRLIVTADDSLLRVSLRSVGPARRELASGACTERQFSSEMNRAALVALAQLREGMTGEFAPILEEWLEIVSKDDRMGVNDP